MRIAILCMSIAFLFTQCKTEKSNTETAQAQAPTSGGHPAQGLDKRDRTKTDKVVAQAKHQHQQKQSTDHLMTGTLQWTTFDRIAKKDMDGNKKKFLVDVYTDWCGWCKVMDKKTFTDPTVQKYLEDNFHVIKFDAEQKAPVPFKGKDYAWKPGGRNGINTLAIELLGNRQSYPTMVYLDENMNKIKSIPGYKKPEQLLSELKAINNS